LCSILMRYERMYTLFSPESVLHSVEIWTYTWLSIHFMLHTDEIWAYNLLSPHFVPHSDIWTYTVCSPHFMLYSYEIWTYAMLSLHFYSRPNSSLASRRNILTHQRFTSSPSCYCWTFRDGVCEAKLKSSSGKASP
jgi:hypothetical protein